MKKLALMVAAIAMAHTGFSQISIDPEIGLNISNIQTKIDGGDAVHSDAKIGLSAGAGVSIDLDKGLYVKPGLYYYMLGGENEAFGISTHTTMHYLRVPVNLGYSYTLSDKAGAIFVEAGPYAGYALAGETKTETLVGDIENDIEFGDKMSETRAFDWGFNFHVGYESPWGAYLKGGYGLGMGNLSNADDITQTHNNWNIALGYRIKL